MTSKGPLAPALASTAFANPQVPTPPSQVRLTGDQLDGEVAPKQGRSRRKRAVRGKSICVKRLTKLEIALGRALFPDMPVERPRTRADCDQGERPCPFVSCTHHLYLDVFERTGAIKLNFPDLEVWEMSDSCALDVADRGGTTLEQAGALMNLTRERVRQLEVKALAKLESTMQPHPPEQASPPVSSAPSGKRRLAVLR
jgi:hypothetical protein